MRRKEGDMIQKCAVLWSGSSAGGSVINRLSGSGCAGWISNKLASWIRILICNQDNGSSDPGP
jgi:hypothetical protein